MFMTLQQQGAQNRLRLGGILEAHDRPLEILTREPKFQKTNALFRIVTVESRSPKWVSAEPYSRSLGSVLTMIGHG